MKVKDLLRMKIFWILLIMMVCQKAERHYFLYTASYRNPTNATIPPLRVSKTKSVPFPHFGTIVIFYGANHIFYMTLYAL